MGQTANDKDSSETTIWVTSLFPQKKKKPWLAMVQTQSNRVNGEIVRKEVTDINFGHTTSWRNEDCSSYILFLLCFDLYIFLYIKQLFFFFFPIPSNLTYDVLIMGNPVFKLEDIKRRLWQVSHLKIIRRQI